MLPRQLGVAQAARDLEDPREKAETGEAFEADVGHATSAGFPGARSLTPWKESCSRGRVW